MYVCMYIRMYVDVTMYICIANIICVMYVIGYAAIIVIISIPHHLQRHIVI